MKVGLSYSRCVRDIVEGRVNIDDVLVIIARTDFDPRNDEQWTAIWEGYRHGGWSNPEWNGYEGQYEEEFRRVTLELYNNGKLHQPRQFGKYVHRSHEVWLDVVGSK